MTFKPARVLRLSSIASAATLFALASQGALAAPGDLDLTFNGGVFDVTVGAGGNDAGAEVAIQGDGRVLVGGSSALPGGGSDWALLRRNTDGTPDTTFGAGTGQVVIGVGGLDFGATSGQIEGLAVQADGKIVAAGTASAATGNHDVLAVARFNANGSLDTGFGTGGKVYVDLSSTGTAGHAVGVQRDGRIVVVGTQRGGAGLDAQVVVARLTAAGALDTGFASGGIFHLPASVPVASRGWAFTMAIQPDGKILAGTQIDSNPVVLRLTTSGALDATFGSGGIATVPIVAGSAPPPAGDSVVRLQVLPNGRILGVAVDAGIWMFQLLRNGSVDTAFGPPPSTGWISASPAPMGMLRLPTGPIRTVGGQECNCLALKGYTADGRNDVAFPAVSLAGPSGLSGRVLFHEIALQTDGRLVATGIDNGRIVLARFTGDALRLFPKTFAFQPVTGVPLSTLAVSEAQRITSLTVGAYVPIQVTGGSYSVNGAAPTTRLGYVTNGDVVTVEHTSAATHGAAVTTTLRVGGLGTATTPWVVNGSTVVAKFTSTTQ